MEINYSNIYALDINRLKSTISSAPISKTGLSVHSNVIIEIPQLDGNFEKYAIYETSNMAPELAQKFPDIKSYRGISVKDAGKTLSFGLSPKGIKVILFSQGKRPAVVEPITNDSSIYLVSPAVGDLLPKGADFKCHTGEEDNAHAKKNVLFPTDNTNDKKYRTYRLAVAADGEFSAYHGGTVAGTIAAINDLMSYFNPIYERDLSIHLNLIVNNDQIISLDQNTDPYTYSSTVTGQLNQQTQKTITTVIGEANYDLGILFTNQDTGGGSSGALAVVCKNSTGTLANGTVDVQKGGAYIGGFVPQGFIFAIAVAHEIGHQFGANHTFSKPENMDITLLLFGLLPIQQINNPETGANREPASGVTVMGYPGVTGTYDVMDKFSDQFLHYSISQINSYVKTTSCAVTTDIPNNPPIADAGSDYTIPKGTAFKLTGSGTDPDNNPLTFSWEESDISAPNSHIDVNITIPVDNAAVLAQIQQSNKPYNFPDRLSATNPSFRVYPPTSSPVRYMPPLKEVLDGSLYNMWNMVSDVSRSMNFVNLVRDNAPGGGQTATDNMMVNVDGNTGPFKITSLSLNQNYPSGFSHLLKWDVNGTNGAPINTSSVNILISTDGGNTFSPLISNTSNDGEEAITIPSTSSKKAYIIVESVGNIFYAASPAFAINYNISLTCTQYPATGTFAIAPGAPANLTSNVPVTTDIEDIILVMDLSYTDLKNISLTLKGPTDQERQIFWYRNCPGNTNLKATFDQEGQSLAANCNNLNGTPAVHIEPIRLDLSKYYGQNPNGNWIIRASDVVTGSTSSGTVNAAAIELCTRQATSTLGTQETQFSEDDVQIYPNPSDGRFNILMRKDALAEVQVFDAAGRLVYVKTGVNNDTKFDLTHFSKGNYIVVVNMGNKKIAKKIIIK